MFMTGRNIFSRRMRMVVIPEYQPIALLIMISIFIPKLIGSRFRVPGSRVTTY